MTKNHFFCIFGLLLYRYNIYQVRIEFWKLFDILVHPIGHIRSWKGGSTWVKTCTYWTRHGRAVERHGGYHCHCFINNRGAMPSKLKLKKGGIWCLCGGAVDGWTTKDKLSQTSGWRYSQGKEKGSWSYITKNLVFLKEPNKYCHLSQSSLVRLSRTFHSRSCNCFFPLMSISGKIISKASMLFVKRVFWQQPLSYCLCLVF